MAYFAYGKISCHISFFVDTFCRLFDFGQKSKMTLEDFHHTQSDHSITQELFQYGFVWKLSKNIGFHRNQCKIGVIYGNATPGLCNLFQNQSHLFIVMLSSFILLLSNIVSYSVQELKGKHVFRKIVIIHVRQFVSSVARKGNPITETSPYKSGPRFPRNIK